MNPFSTTFNIFPNIARLRPVERLKSSSFNFSTVSNFIPYYLTIPTCARGQFYKICFDYYFSSGLATGLVLSNVEAPH